MEMKKASLICLILGIIIISIGIVLFSLHFSDVNSSEKPKNDEENSQLEDKEILEYSENVYYHCEREPYSYQGKINNSAVDQKMIIMYLLNIRVNQISFKKTTTKKT